MFISVIYHIDDIKSCLKYFHEKPTVITIMSHQTAVWHLPADCVALISTWGLAPNHDRNVGYHRSLGCYCRDVGCVYRPWVSCFLTVGSYCLVLVYGLHVGVLSYHDGVLSLLAVESRLLAVGSCLLDVGSRLLDVGSCLLDVGSRSQMELGFCLSVMDLSVV